MSTPATITIIDETKPVTEIVAVIYRQHDGDPAHLGVKLADYILSGEVVDGLRMSGDPDDPIEWNTIYDFAAALVCELKTRAGGVYLSGSQQQWYSQFDYVVVLIDESDFRIDIFEGEEFGSAQLFSGAAVDVRKSAAVKEHS